MQKPTVLFPYVEAGMGHIVPMRAIAKKFKELYGDKVICREINFYTSGGAEELILFEERMKQSVVKQNVNHLFGFMMTNAMQIFGAKISTAASAHCLKINACKAAVKYMDELAPDLVFSTHWSTNYFAAKCKTKPLTALYCPDVALYPIFEYPCDLTLTPTRYGYEKALKKKRRYNGQNLKYAMTAIDDNAFFIPDDKERARRELGLTPDKFTVLFAEGGYGIGKCGEICRRIIERDLPVTMIAICGTNEKLFEELSHLKTEKNSELKLTKFTDRMQHYFAASDLFCGKSGGNVMSEATFAGVPQIITKYASGIEKMNGKYYEKEIKTAIKIFSPKKVVSAIESFAAEPEKLSPLRDAAILQRENYGAERSAKLIFELLCTRFPELKESDKRVSDIKLKAI